MKNFQIFDILITDDILNRIEKPTFWNGFLGNFEKCSSLLPNWFNSDSFKTPKASKKFWLSSYCLKRGRRPPLLIVFDKNSHFLLFSYLFCASSRRINQVWMAWKTIAETSVKIIFWKGIYSGELVKWKEEH